MTKGIWGKNPATADDAKLTDDFFIASCFAPKKSYNPVAEGKWR